MVPVELLTALKYSAIKTVTKNNAKKVTANALVLFTINLKYLCLIIRIPHLAILHSMLLAKNECIFY